MRGRGVDRLQLICISLGRTESIRENEVRRLHACLLAGLAVALIACGEDARINASAVLPPPLMLDMLTVTVRDGDRLIEWEGADFQPRPTNGTPSTLDADVRTSGPDFEVSFRLESNGALLSTGTVTVPRRSDWHWNISVFAATVDPEESCFGCFGSQAFPLVEAVRVPERDSIWLVWGGNSISDPVIY